MGQRREDVALEDGTEQKKAGKQDQKGCDQYNGNYLW
jgi:hypothetical protein